MVQPVIEPVGPDEPSTDRRRMRTERGRDLVVDALLSFFAEGDPQPGVAKIAARAGVSERSVFRYFDDLESLAGAAIERQIARIAPVFRPPRPSGDLESRISALVDPQHPNGLRN